MVDILIIIALIVILLSQLRVLNILSSYVQPVGYTYTSKSNCEHNYVLTDVTDYDDNKGDRFYVVCANCGVFDSPLKS